MVAVSKSIAIKVCMNQYDTVTLRGQYTCISQGSRRRGIEIRGSVLPQIYIERRKSPWHSKRPIIGMKSRE